MNKAIFILSLISILIVIGIAVYGHFYLVAEHELNRLEDRLDELAEMKLTPSQKWMLLQWAEQYRLGEKYLARGRVLKAKKEAMDANDAIDEAFPWGEFPSVWWPQVPWEETGA